MTGQSTAIAGIEIPSSDPVFLSIVAVHVFLGLVAVAAGAFATLSTKAPGRHPTAGRVYYWAIAGIFASATALSITRWAEDYRLFVLGAMAFAAASLGRIAKRSRWLHALPLHIIGMGSSYVFLLTAFYVDNGKQLPLWRELPAWTYWTLPLAVGAPLMLWAALRHPRVKAERLDRRRTRAADRIEMPGPL